MNLMFGNKLIFNTEAFDTIEGKAEGFILGQIK